MRGPERNHLSDRLEQTQVKKKKKGGAVAELKKNFLVFLIVEKIEQRKKP